MGKIFGLTDATPETKVRIRRFLLMLFLQAFFAKRAIVIFLDGFNRSASELTLVYFGALALPVLIVLELCAILKARKEGVEGADDLSTDTTSDDAPD